MNIDAETRLPVRARPDADNAVSAWTGDPLVTIIVTPRERFGVAAESLRSVIEHTDLPYRLVYIDAGSPRHVARDISRLCAENGFSHVRINGYLSPNAARNMGLRLAATRHVVFLDNDVIVSGGWLEALVGCAEETGAEVVAPLTCQREPLHSEIHQAGGEFASDHRAFFAAAPEDHRITDIHVLQGRKVSETRLARGETQCCEFHCALVRRDAFERFGELDEGLLATKEHIDFCMTVWSGGGRVMFEPAAVVTYLFPGRERPLNLSDWPYFALRWSPAWQRQSLEHFRDKWSLHHDPYFGKREKMLSWRLSEGMAKPVVSRVPMIRKSYRLRVAALKALTAVLDRWSDRLVRQHARRARSAASCPEVTGPEMTRQR